jgi:FHA domain
VGVEAKTDTVEEWQKLRQGMTRDQFATRFAHPFLLRQKLRRTSTGVEHRPEDWTERVAFETEVRDDPGLPAPSLAGGRMRGARVAPVVKVPGHPFPDRISVGRALNCDIVLRDPSVSKLHAHFKVLGPGEAELTDIKSVNGTRVNGEWTTSGQAVRVESGDTIIFGGVACQFLDPKALFDLL